MSSDIEECSRAAVDSRVAVVVLNWNGAELLETFIPTLLKFSKGDNIDIYIADNGSTDRSLEAIDAISKDIKIIELESNFGFAEGYNRALKQVDADYYILLNSDVAVTEGWIEPMLDMMESDIKLVAVQPKILAYSSYLDRIDSSTTTDSRGSATINPISFEYAGAAGGGVDLFGYPFCRGRLFSSCEYDEGQYNDSRDIFWASGAAMMVRASSWRELDGLDGDFFAHMEEIDLCWRAWNMGYKVGYCADSSIYHVGGATLTYGSANKNYLNFRNSLLMIYKNLPSVTLIPTLFFRMVLDGVAATMFLVKGEGKLFYAVLRAHLYFYRALLRGDTKRRSTVRLRGVTPPIYRGSIVLLSYLFGERISPKF